MALGLLASQLLASLLALCILYWRMLPSWCGLLSVCAAFSRGGVAVCDHLSQDGTVAMEVCLAGCQ